VTDGSMFFLPAMGVIVKTGCDRPAWQAPTRVPSVRTATRRIDVSEPTTPADAPDPGGNLTAKGKLKSRYYEAELARLQIELAKLQSWIKAKGLKVVVIFEGRDAAGKGGVIKRITERLNPRICRVEALGTPTDREKTQWYFQRYVERLPAAGEIVLFDRSWYNRAGVERVMGFCTDEEYEEFLRSCPEFERMLVRSGIILLKYWFSVSRGEQERRFQDRMGDPKKRWKLSDMDLESRMMWEEYSKAKDGMLAYTDIKKAPAPGLHPPTDDRPDFRARPARRHRRAATPGLTPRCNLLPRWDGREQRVLCSPPLRRGRCPRFGGRGGRF